MIACRPLAPQQGGPHVQRQDCDAETPGGEGRNRGSLGPAPLRSPAGSRPWLRLRLRPETGARERGAARTGRREGGAGASGRGAATGFCLGDRDTASAEAEGPAPEASSGLVIALMNII